MVKDYWDRDANGNVKSFRYANAHTIAAVGKNGAGVGLMLFYARDPAQAQRVSEDGLDACEKLPLYLSAASARALIAGLQESLRQAEEQLENSN